MADVKSRHPDYTADRVAEWALMRDAMDGESAIKSAGETYLPMPSGFLALGDEGSRVAYGSYRGRAQFPEIVTPSIGAMVGIAHGKEVQIEMPDAMGYLWEAATDGDNPLSLEAFHRRITRHLLTFGRYAVLADAPEGGGNPFLSGYAHGNLINWDAGFYVLDETAMVRDGFDWVQREQYRVLTLEEGSYVQRLYTGDDLVAGEDIFPSAQGGRGLDFIPLAVANARDLTPDVETPPLIGVARAALAMYQLSADKRHQLYMSGQEMLVAVNCNAPEYVGAGAAFEAISEGEKPADLKYVGPSCIGIEAHERAIKDAREEAVMAGAKMLEQSEQVQESGNARELRFASETASLKSVVMASCGLLERSLKNVAVMLGQSPDAVVVTPPKDLMDRTMTATDAKTLFEIFMDGGVSWDTYHENLQRGGIMSPERTADDERALIGPTEMDQPE